MMMKNQTMPAEYLSTEGWQEFGKPTAGSQLTLVSSSMRGRRERMFTV